MTERFRSRSIADAEEYVKKNYPRLYKEGEINPTKTSQ